MLIFVSLLLSGLLVRSRALGADLAQLVEREKGSVVFIRITFETSGVHVIREATGLIVSEKGDVLTAAHLLKEWLGQDDEVRARNPIKVSVQSRYASESIEARVVTTANDSDVAMLRLIDPTKTYRSVPLCYASPPGSGTHVFALGFPTQRELTPVEGIFSNDNNPKNYWEIVAPIEDGVTGGPVYDENGFVIGLVEHGAGNSAFVIPVKWVKSLIEDRTATLPSCGPNPTRAPALEPSIQIEIASPALASVYPEKYKVPLSATAFDPWTRSLADSDYRWTTTTGLDLGTGPSVTVNTLPIGNHRVVMTVSDKMGRVNKASVDVTIKPAGTRVVWGTKIPLEGRCGSVLAWGHFVAATTKNDLQHEVEKVSIFDITDLRSPKLLSSVPIYYPSRLVKAGSTLYVSSEDGSFRVIDVSNPTMPKQRATSRASQSLGAVLEMAYGNGLLGLKGLLGGVELVDVRGPEPHSLSWFPKQITAQGGLGFQGSHVLVAERYAGFKVYDIADPTNPFLVGSVNGTEQEFSTNVIVSGDFAFVDSWAGIFESVYLGDITKPLVFGRLPGTGNAFRIALNGKKIFVAGNNEGLQVVDVSVPVRPAYDSSFPELGYVADVSIEDGLIGVCTDTSVAVGTIL